MKTFERIEELKNRIKTLESGCNQPVTDIEQSSLQTAINDANVMHKYARAIEYELRGIYKKLFGNDWDPEGPAVFEIPTPTREDIEAMRAADVIFEDPKTQDEIERFLQEDK